MERGDKPWLLESQESSYHLWLNTFNRCGFFCPQNVSILWWSSRQSHSTKTGFTPPKNKCSLICHHVNPARSPSDTTARKAACQRLKQCYSNITLECLHTSGISHTHTHTHTPFLEIRCSSLMSGWWSGAGSKHKRMHWPITATASPFTSGVLSLTEYLTTGRW